MADSYSIACLDCGEGSDMVSRVFVSVDERDDWIVQHEVDQPTHWRQLTISQGDGS